MVYTDGNYNNPAISKIIEFFLDYETEIDEARRRVYVAERNQSEIEDAYSIIENTFGQGCVAEVTSYNNRAIKRYDRRTKRGKSKSDTYHCEFLQNRIRNVNEIIRKANGKNVKNDMLKKVHQMMGHVKSNEEVSIEYMKIFEREKMIREEGREEEAKQVACSLFENGANYELVRASITILSDEELKAIYEAVKAVKQ